MSDAVELTAAEHAILDAIDSAGDEMIARVKSWSEVNSGSANREGLDAMRARLPEAFEPLEAEMDEVELPPTEIVTRAGEVVTMENAPALRVRARVDAPIQIVLTGHYDTVFPADSAFQDWRLLDDDTINGPGVADMKGGILVMAEALKALERHPKREAIGYTALISPDEETGSHGSREMLHELGARAHVGMTYEPALADGGLAGARKGSGNFSLVVRGRAAHAGREHHLGRNALEAMSRFIVELQALNGAREGVTFNVGEVAGGGPVNIVPDLGVCRFNVRLQTEEDGAWAMTEINRLVGETDARDGVAAALHGGFTRPPKPMSPQNAKMFAWTKAAGAAVGVDVFWNDTGGVCEGNNLWAAGCPNVDTLGVRGGDIHSDREFAKLSSFPERAKLSAVMLFRFASGDFDARANRNL